MSTRLLNNGGLIGYNTPELYTDTYRGTTPLFVGGGSVSAFGSAAATITFSSSLSGGISPVGGLQQGDLVVVGWAVTGGAGDLTLSLTTTGYTKLYDLYQTGTTQYINLGVFYKVMGATPDTTVVAPANTSNNQHVLSVQVWRNVDTSSPISTSATASGTNAGSTNPPAITTVKSRAPIVVFGGAGHGAGTVNYTAPADLSGFTTSGANGTTYDATGGVGHTYSTSSGQSVDPTGWAGPTGSTGSWIAATIELNTLSLGKNNSGIWNLSSSASSTYVNSFEDPTLPGWTSVSTNTLTATGVRSHSGLYSTQTNSSVDTDGVYTSLKRSFTRDFTVEYWGYLRPCSIYLLDASGQGYGLRMLSSTFEIRRKSSFTTAGTAIATGSGAYAQANKWFRCKFVANADNTFTATVYDTSGLNLGTVTSTADTTYTGPFTLLLLNTSGAATTSYFDDIKVYKNA